MIVLIWLFILLLVLFFLCTVQEGYTQPKEIKYSEKTITGLTEMMKTNNVPESFLAVFQKYGTPEANAITYISSGLWPYSKSVIDVIKHSGSFDGDTNDRVSNFQKMFSEETILFLLSVKAGKENIQSLIPFKVGCKIDASGSSIGTGMYALDDSNAATGDPLDNTSLITKIPGFQFLGNECNPCDIYNNKFDCPFAVPGSDKRPLLPHPALQYVWGIFPTAASAAIDSLVSPAAVPPATSELPKLF